MRRSRPSGRTRSARTSSTGWSARCGQRRADRATPSPRRPRWAVKPPLSLIRKAAEVGLIVNAGEVKRPKWSPDPSVQAFLKNVSDGLILLGRQADEQADGQMGTSFPVSHRFPIVSQKRFSFPDPYKRERIGGRDDGSTEPAQPLSETKADRRATIHLQTGAAAGGYGGRGRVGLGGLRRLGGQRQPSPPSPRRRPRSGRPTSERPTSPRCWRPSTPTPPGADGGSPSPPSPARRWSRSGSP